MPLERAAPGTPGFSRNVATEVNAGKPEKQAVAIAYNQARGDAKPAGSNAYQLGYETGKEGSKSRLNEQLEDNASEKEKEDYRRGYKAGAAVAGRRSDGTERQDASTSEVIAGRERRLAKMEALKKQGIKRPPDNSYATIEQEIDNLRHEIH